MTQTTSASFDANYPYRLSEADFDSLLHVQGLLGVLVALSGQASIGHEHCSPMFNSLELHRALWAIETPLRTLVETISKQDGVIE